MILGQDYPNGVLSNDRKQLTLRPVVVSEDFFKVFSFKVIAGKRIENALGKRDILLSETTALQFFNITEVAIGAIVKWKHSVFEGAFQVAGVVKDAPRNSTMQFDVIFSFDVLQDATEDLDEWYASAGQTFWVLTNDTDIEQFNKKIRNYLRVKLREE